MSKSWIVTKKLNPAILGQPNIPKPLHTINPRTIMGYDNWRNLRQSILNKQPYCTACGSSTNLEIHEDYTFNFTSGEALLNSYVPVCKMCHMFIHSGRLTSLLAKREISLNEVTAIVIHGLNICKANNIRVYYVMYDLAKYLKISLKGINSWKPNVFADWNKWHLIYENKKYSGLSKQAWNNLYG